MVAWQTFRETSQLLSKLIQIQSRSRREPDHLDLNNLYVEMVPCRCYIKVCSVCPRYPGGSQLEPFPIEKRLLRCGVSEICFNERTKYAIIPRRHPHPPDLVKLSRNSIPRAELQWD